MHVILLILLSSMRVKIIGQSNLTMSLATVPNSIDYCYAGLRGVVAIDQNADFKIIALENILIYNIYRISHGLGMTSILFQRICVFSIDEPCEGIENNQRVG